MNCDVPIRCFLLLWMTLMVTVSAQTWFLSGTCEPCKCSIHNTGTEHVRNVDCFNLNLKEIPSNLPKDLDVLNFANNNLPSENVKGIRKFAFLQSLSLANNNITMLDDSPFSKSPLLTTVTLTGNTITKLTQKAFAGLRNLKSLYGLKIELAEARVFQPLPLLVKLDLEITSPEIPEKIFDGLMVNFLNLTFTRAQELPHNIFAFGSNTVKTLYLAGPKLKDLHEDLLWGLTFLNFIHLELPSVTSLPEHLFSNYPVNDSVSNSINLKTIELISVESLPIGIFSGLDHLMVLMIKKAEQLPQRHLFDSLVNLQILVLSQSFISRIPVKWFEKLNNLVALSVDQTSLRRLDAESFTGLNKLETLNLSFNSLRVIPKDVFTPLRNTLENLDLSMNILKNIETGALRGMYSLKTLDLGDNKMSSLQSEIFTDLIRLSVLNIQENKLSFLPKELFHSQQRLNKLNLASNSFSSFQQALIEVSGLLIYLDLSNNQIRDLGHCFGNKFPFLEFLSLDLNPLHCNCNILKLSESHPYLRLEGICASPKEFANQQVKTISMPDRCHNITCDSASVGSTPTIHRSVDPELITVSVTNVQNTKVISPLNGTVKAEPLPRSNSTNIHPTTIQSTEYDSGLHSSSPADTDIERSDYSVVDDSQQSYPRGKTYIFDVMDGLWKVSDEAYGNESMSSNITRSIQSRSRGNEKSPSIFERIEFKVVIGVIAGCAFLILFAVVLYLKKKHYSDRKFVFSPSARNEI